MLDTTLARQVGGFGHYPYAEDYDLYTRLSGDDDITNLQEVLLLARFNLNSISRTMPPAQKAHYFQTISRAAVSRFLGREVPLDVVKHLRVMRLFSHRDAAGEHHWTSQPLEIDPQILRLALQLYKDLYEGFVQRYPLSEETHQRLKKDLQFEITRLAQGLPASEQEGALTLFA
jgi:hypothetical protein